MKSITVASIWYFASMLVERHVTRLHLGRCPADPRRSHRCAGNQLQATLEGSQNGNGNPHSGCPRHTRACGRTWARPRRPCCALGQRWLGRQRNRRTRQIAGLVRLRWSASIFSMPAPHPHLQRNSTGRNSRKGKEVSHKNHLSCPLFHHGEAETFVCSIEFVNIFYITLCKILLCYL